MALFISKPILWNRDGYVRPSGVRANSGFPKDHGFGHEEWNNSPALSFTEDGVHYRTFHTEGLGTEPIDDEAGQIVIFMYASHDAVQELVGVAARATCLTGDQAERERLTKLLKLGRLGDEAWRMSSVKSAHRGERSVFDEVWQRDISWIPNWRCPAETFLWLNKPAPLNPHKLRGKSKLLTMFGRHTKIDREEALAILESIPSDDRTPTWTRIRAEIAPPETETIGRDLSNLMAQTNVKTTMKEQLIKARVGQGLFRTQVERYWEGGCAVSGCVLKDVLRASHIKSWADSSDNERLDPNNGLLLTADLDALFDRGLISFAGNGEMLVSKLVTEQNRELFRLPRPLRKPPSSQQQKFLTYHRRNWAFEDPT